MTQARRIRPGRTYLITRRTLRRHHLLCPDGKVDRVFLYVLAVYARKHHIQVHLPVLMSTHEHLVLSDPDGLLPDFLRDLHRHVALPVKIIRQWEGAVWDHEPTSVVELLTPQAVIEELAYCMANPVEAGLVRYAMDWPGVSARPRDLGRRKWRVERPDVYFNPKNWPDHVELELTLPPMLLAEHSPDDVRRLVAEELRRQEQAARAQVASKGGRFRGADRCRKGSPYKRTTTFEPQRSRNPAFAVGRGQPAVFHEAAEALRAFRTAYRAARELWCKGDRTVRFPYGTWEMLRHHGAHCTDPPGAAA